MMRSTSVLSPHAEEQYKRRTTSPSKPKSPTQSIQAEENKGKEISVKMRWSATALFLTLCLVTTWSPSIALPNTADANTEDRIEFADSTPEEKPKRQLRHGYATYDRSSVATSMRPTGQTDVATHRPDLEQLQREHSTASSSLSGTGGHSLLKNEQVTQGLLQICRRVTLDFVKAANGRPMFGGEFVSGEWYFNYGVSIDAEGRNGDKNLNPMIFDSSDVASNGLGDDHDIYALGSPNHDCGGLGVGIGGKEGKPGENCKPLGNLLIPSRKPGYPTHIFSDGGVLIFEFDKLTKVENIDLLNAKGSNNIMVIHNDGSLQHIDLPSTDQNGFQSVSLNLEKVRKLHVVFDSFAAISGLDLCVVVD